MRGAKSQNPDLWNSRPIVIDCTALRALPRRRAEVVAEGGAEAAEAERRTREREAEQLEQRAAQKRAADAVAAARLETEARRAEATAAAIDPEEKR